MGAGDSKEVEYDPKTDVCRPKLEAYLACVEGKQGGTQVRALVLVTVLTWHMSRVFPCPISYMCPRKGSV